MTVLTGKISRQAWMASPETQRVMEALLSDSGDARFVGGCVRDALANRKVIDIDIATPLPPEEVIARLKKHKINFAPTGLKHGTVTAIVEGRPYEITTLRLDVMTFGRHAEVKFTDDWQQDAARRDFTVNAMSANMEGDVYDYFGGIEDLRLGRIVFVGDPEKRIREDILRILRYFRFLAHFGKGTPDMNALRACQALAGEIPKLSAERIRQEVLKLLEAQACAPVWEIMLQAGVVTRFLPEAMDIRALARLTALEEKVESPPFPLRRLAALLDVTAEGLKHVIDSLRLSNAQADQLTTMVSKVDNVSVHMEHREIRRLVYKQGNDLARSLLLLASAKAGEEGDLRNLYDWATSFRAPRFPLQGQDVMMLGWRAGPDVGAILAGMEEWWMDEDFAPGRSACLAKLREEFTPEA